MHVFVHLTFLSWKRHSYKLRHNRHVKKSTKVGYFFVIMILKLATEELKVTYKRNCFNLMITINKDRLLTKNYGISFIYIYMATFIKCCCFLVTEHWLCFSIHYCIVFYFGFFIESHFSRLLLNNYWSCFKLHQHLRWGVWRWKTVMHASHFPKRNIFLQAWGGWCIVCCYNTVDRWKGENWWTETFLK